MPDMKSLFKRNLKILKIFLGESLDNVSYETKF